MSAAAAFTVLMCAIGVLGLLAALADWRTGQAQNTATASKKKRPSHLRMVQ
jgi:mannose/fructose/N-acetylgalactosamine-specific phosphotransferase system component IIC